MNSISLNRRVVGLAIPAALKHLLEILQLLVDMLMVGSLGVAALAAVGLSMQFLMLIQALMSVYVVGANAIISRYIGSGRRYRASMVFYGAGLVAFALSMGVAGVGWGGSERFFEVMGSSPDVIGFGSDYLAVLSLGMSLIFLDALAFSALSAAGDTKSSLYIKVVSVALNAFLNYLFIFGHGGFEAMGVQGAAYATLCAYAFNVIIYGWLLFRGNVLSFLPRFPWNDMKRMIRIGLPAVYERFIGVASFLFFVGMIASYGTEALAGYQVGLRIEAIAYMPGFGFSVAAMALVGQYLGAKREDDAYQAGALSMQIAMAFMGSIGVVFVFLPELLVRIFTEDKETIQYASLYLRLVGLAQIPLAITFVLSGALRGAGATKTTLKISLVSLWLFRIIPSWIAIQLGMSIIAIFVIMNVETLIKGIWFWHVYRQKRWTTLKL